MECCYVPIRIVTNKKKQTKLTPGAEDAENCSSLTFWWDWEMVQPLQRIACQFFIKLNTHLPGHPANNLDMYPREIKTCADKKICT